MEITNILLNSPWVREENIKKIGNVEFNDNANAALKYVRAKEKAQIAEHMPSIYEALTLIPCTSCVLEGEGCLSVVEPMYSEAPRTESFIKSSPLNQELLVVSSELQRTAGNGFS